MVGDEELVEGIEKGTKVRVKTPVTVYHSPKLGDFNLEGKEGEVMEVGLSLAAIFTCVVCGTQQAVALCDNRLR